MAEEEHGWAKIEEFADKEGRRVTKFTVVEGPEKDEVEYRGQVMMSVQTTSSSEPQHVPLEFDFPKGSSFAWITEHFDEQAEKAIEGWKQKQQENAKNQGKGNVITEARQQILGPNGETFDRS